MSTKLIKALATIEAYKAKFTGDATLKDGIPLGKDDVIESLYVQDGILTIVIEEYDQYEPMHRTVSFPVQFADKPMTVILREINAYSAKVEAALAEKWAKQKAEAERQDAEREAARLIAKAEADRLQAEAQKAADLKELARLKAIYG